MRIDHVIVAATDLDAAAARLEDEHGLRACGGGRHEGLGTHNRIVPLGGGYLEILAVADAAEAGRTELGRALATPFLPFFLARDPGIEDPGASGAAGGIEWIEVAGDPARLDTWLGGARLPVRVVEGAPALRAVGIGGRILR